MKSPLNLKTEKPTLSWQDWWLELNKVVASTMKIPLNAAGRYLNIDKAEEWYKDGHTPEVAFKGLFFKNKSDL